MLIQIIVDVVEVSSGAIVHVAATAVEDVVKLGHSLCLLSVRAGSCTSDIANLATVARLFVR